MEPLSCRRWTEEELHRELDSVRSLYPTGQEVDLEETLEYHRGLPERQRVYHAFTRAREEGTLLLHPRAGVATVEQMIQVLLALQDQGTADILPINPDSYTRRNMFAEMERGMAESRARGHSLLNGFPVTAHGVKGFRRLMDAIDRPIGTRTNTPIIELVATLAIAGGQH